MRYYAGFLQIKSHIQNLWNKFGKLYAVLEISNDEIISFTNNVLDFTEMYQAKMLLLYIRRYYYRRLTYLLTIMPSLARKRAILEERSYSILIVNKRTIFAVWCNH